jgi:dihydrofolate reductase
MPDCGAFGNDAGRAVVGAGSSPRSHPSLAVTDSHRGIIKRVILTLIASVAQNGVIGRSGNLAWRNRDDLQRVKRMTVGRTLVMGRRTFESIGRPLPDRHTIVVTRQTNWAPGGITVASSLAAAMAEADSSEVACFGGGEIYAQLIGDADRLEITEIESVLDGDVYFPTIDPTCWRETERVQRDGYSWVTYLREAQGKDAFRGED